MTLVGLGLPAAEHDLRIVDPATGRPRAEGEMGQVLVTGPSLSQGYLGAPDRSARAFGTWIEGDPRRGCGPGTPAFCATGSSTSPGGSMTS